MVYITGDIHGDIARIVLLCEMHETTTDDILIILGDAGFNYFEDKRDKFLKKQIAELPITIFCIHGNHEQRPEELPGANMTIFAQAPAWQEPEFPNIFYAEDGEIYIFNNKEYIVIGGAYSVDKHYRLTNGWKWWENEQPSLRTKTYFEDQCDFLNWNVHGVLSHTCPLKYEPVEVFLPMIDQNTVDKSTEEWLDSIENQLDYKQWYCGHYHTDKNIDKIKFMFKHIEELK